MSDIVKTGQFIKVKIISAVIILIGIISSIIWFVTETKRYQESCVSSFTYNYKNPITGKMVYHSGSDIGELSLSEFVKSDHMNSAIWIETIVILVAFIVIAVLMYAFYFNQKFNITNEGLNGKCVLGKAVDIKFSQISSIKKSFLKGVTVITTGQDKVKFRLLKNQSELIEEINNNINNSTSKNTTPISDSSESTDSSADQIVKYKELLDSGVITQEEFDAKKKQLLGI